MDKLKFGELTTDESSSNPAVLTTAMLGKSTYCIEKSIVLPRASSIYDSCMRMHVICTILKKKQKQYLKLNDTITFGIGNAVHYWCQNDSSLFGDERYGLWKCLACGTISSFGKKPTAKCSCGANPKVFEYYEFGDVIKEPYMFSFHVDMFKKCDDFYRIHEFKTISVDAFNKLAAPLIQHEYQVITYMLGCYHSKKLQVKIDPLVGYITYIAKGSIGNGLPIKMFVVKNNKNILKKIQDKLNQYKNGIIDYPKNIPPLSCDCAAKNFDCWKAKTCPVVGECKNLR